MYRIVKASCFLRLTSHPTAQWVRLCVVAHVNDNQTADAITQCPLMSQMPFMRPMAAGKPVVVAVVARAPASRALAIGTHVSAQTTEKAATEQLCMREGSAQGTPRRAAHRLWAVGLSMLLC